VPGREAISKELEAVSVNSDTLYDWSSRVAAYKLGTKGGTKEALDVLETEIHRAYLETLHEETMAAVFTPPASSVQLACIRHVDRTPSPTE